MPTVERSVTRERRHAEAARPESIRPELVDEVPRWATEAVYEAQRRLVTTSPAAMAGRLQELFGQRITAVMTGVDDPKTVGRWVRGQQPQPAHYDRLQAAFHVVSLLEIAESAQVARAWFLGMNPDLDDQSPASVLADDPTEGGRRIMRAAHSFLAHG